MVRSLYSGVSGLRTHQTRMDVIGNNISNVNTYGYKASRVAFKDLFYQTISGASAPQGAAGGVNPKQVGYGSMVASIDVMHTRTGFQMTDLGTDLAIAGEGFFQTMDPSGNMLYTRAGMLRLDPNGNLTDANGNKVVGTNGNKFDSNKATGQDGIQLIVPELDAQAASVKKELLGSLVSIEMKETGPQGNMTFMFVNGKDPAMSNVKGNVVTIYFDHSQKLTTIDELKAKMDYSFLMGGVPLSTSDMNITFDPDPKLDVKPSTVKGNMAASGSFTTIPVALFDDGTGVTAGTGPGTGAAAPNLNFTIVPAGDKGNGVQVVFNITAATGQKSARWIDNKLQMSIPEGTKLSPSDLTALAKNASGKAPTGVSGIQFSTLGNTPLYAGLAGTSSTAAMAPTAGTASGGLTFTMTGGATDDRMNALLGDGINVRFVNGTITTPTPPGGAAVGPGGEQAFWDGTNLYISLSSTGGTGGATAGTGQYTTADMQFLIANADKTNLDPAFQGDILNIISKMSIDFGTGVLDATKLVDATGGGTPLDISTVKPFIMSATDGSAPAKQSIPDVGGAQVSATIGQTGEKYNGFQVVFKAVPGADPEITKSGSNQIVITLDSEDDASVIDQAFIDNLFSKFVSTLDDSEVHLKNMQITVNGQIDVQDMETRQKGTVSMKLVGGENTLMQNILPLLGTMSLTGGRDQTSQSVGDLSSVSIGADGVISAIHDGELIVFGRIELANFDNPGGLEQVGNSYFRVTNNSGQAKKGVPGIGAVGGIVSGGLEMSNVDLSGAFTDMITTQRGFQANSRIITVSDEMLQELVNLKR